MTKGNSSPESVKWKTKDPRMAKKKKNTVIIWGKETVVVKA